MFHAEASLTKKRDLPKTDLRDFSRCLLQPSETKSKNDKFSGASVNFRTGRLAEAVKAKSLGLYKQKKLHIEPFHIGVSQTVALVNFNLQEVKLAKRVSSSEKVEILQVYAKNSPVVGSGALGKCVSECPHKKGHNF